jgi:DNA-binding NarL/FixJ family response regulator
LIRVMIVDDHPAMRAGLETVLEGEPDLVSVGAAAGVFDAQPMYAEARPDVVMLDFHLPGQSSLGLTMYLKRQVLAPHVLLYSAHAGRPLELAAALAGADGVVSKGADARELFQAVRRIAAGEEVAGASTDELMRAAAELLPEEDMPLVAMRLHGEPLAEIAKVQQTDPKALTRHFERLLSRLEPEPVAR